MTGYGRGSHLFRPGAVISPSGDEGYVTSAAFSPTVGAWIGLALLQNGPQRHGERIRVWDPVRAVISRPRSVIRYSWTPKASSCMAESPFLLTRLTGIRMVSLQAARGRMAALLEHAPLRLGVALRDGPHRVAGDGIDSLGIGVGRWLLVRYGAAVEWPADDCRGPSRIAPPCVISPTPMSSSRLQGLTRAPYWRRGVTVDLRPTVMTPDDVAVTNAGHINIVLWQVGGTPSRTTSAWP